VYSPELPGRTVVATTLAASPEWVDEVTGRGVEVIVCGTGPHVDPHYLMDTLGKYGLNEVLVEGGGKILGTLFDAGLVDRVAAFVAPVIVGGAEAPGPVGGTGSETLDTAWRLSDVRWSSLDGDVLIEGAISESRITAETA
jgi:diaminohydroxyphosphoribosylaminopyrimidine deaminase/5-amino-6-(5-phosphoribosylamino)uracil reductase